MRNFVDEQTTILETHVDMQTVQLETHIKEQQENQAAITEELSNNQASFVETQTSERRQFIAEQTAAREAMRTQSEEIAAALSEGRPMSWTAIDYTSAAEPRQEDEVVRVYGRGASIDTQFAVVNVTQNTLGEASVIGVAVEPLNSPNLAFVQLPDERFRMNRAVAVRYYMPNSSQSEERNYSSPYAGGKIRFKEEGVDCSKTKVYSYRLNTSALAELGDGCGWFDFPNEIVATRVYILAENVQD